MTSMSKPIIIQFTRKSFSSFFCSFIGETQRQRQRQQLITWTRERRPLKNSEMLISISWVEVYFFFNIWATPHFLLQHLGLFFLHGVTNVLKQWFFIYKEFLQYWSKSFWNHFVVSEIISERATAVKSVISWIKTLRLAISSVST